MLEKLDVVDQVVLGNHEYQDDVLAFYTKR